MIKTLLFLPYKGGEDMKTMKLKALVMSGLLAASLLASMPVYAADYANPETAKVTKEIKKNEGVTTPEVTFTFTAALTDNPAEQPAAPADAPKTLPSVTISSTAANLSGAFDLTSLTTPGLYTYDIAETMDAPAKDAEGYGWDYNTEACSYKLTVAVDNEGNKKIYLFDKDNKKVDDMDFSNKYTKKGGSEDKTTSLEISKTVSNPAYANPDDEFKVEVTFTRPEVKNDTITSYTGKVGDTVYTFEDGVATTVSLKAGEKLVFDNIEAGAKYTVKETDMNSNYTWEKTEVVANGDTKTEIQNAGDEKNLVGEKTNTAEITNEFKDVSITGVMTTYGPFIAMVAVVIAAIGAYAVIRRKVTR